jgi:hypothetical protein
MWLQADISQVQVLCSSSPPPPTAPLFPRAATQSSAKQKQKQESLILSGHWHAMVNVHKHLHLDVISYEYGGSRQQVKAI